MGIACLAVDAVVADPDVVGAIDSKRDERAPRCQSRQGRCSCRYRRRPAADAAEGVAPPGHPDADSVVASSSAARCRRPGIRRPGDAVGAGGRARLLRHRCPRVGGFASGAARRCIRRPDRHTRGIRLQGYRDRPTVPAPGCIGCRHYSRKGVHHHRRDPSANRAWPLTEGRRVRACGKTPGRGSLRVGFSRLPGRHHVPGPDHFEERQALRTGFVPARPTTYTSIPDACVTIVTREETFDVWQVWAAREHINGLPEVSSRGPCLLPSVAQCRGDTARFPAPFQGFWPNSKPCTDTTDRARIMIGAYGRMNVRSNETVRIDEYDSENCCRNR